MRHMNQRSSPQRTERIQQLLADAAIDADAGKYPLAEKKLKKALQLDPKATLVLARLAEHYLQQHQLTQAMTVCKQALSIDPNNADCHTSLGRTHTLLGQQDSALQHYRLALKANPEHASAHLYYGLALAHDKQTDAAIELFQTYQHHHPLCAEGYFNLATVLLRDNRLEPAIENFEQALRLKPESLHSQLGLALALRSVGDWQSAGTLINKLEQSLLDCPLSLEALHISFQHLLLLFGEHRLSQHFFQKQLKHLKHQSRLKKRPKETSLTARLRIGYLISHHDPFVLAQQVHCLSQHHRHKFEIYFFLMSKANPFQLRQLCDVFIDISADDEHTAIKKIKGRKLQILVDLSDHTQHYPHTLLTHRAAPLQCHLHDYPFFLETDTLDYQFLQKQLVPSKTSQDHQLISRSFAHCCFPELPQTLPACNRDELKLPHDKIIFCSLGDPAWLDEQSFATWLTILQQVPNSILWLCGHSDRLRQNTAHRLAQ